VLVKSSTKDLLRPIFEIAIRQPTTRLRRFVDATYTVQAEAIDTRVIGRSLGYLSMATHFPPEAMKVLQVLQTLMGLQVKS
jgi:hypothetical protein